MRKRLIALLTCVALMVTGCGDIALLKSYDEPQAPMDNKVTVNFSWWGNDERHIYTMNGVDIFQNQNPDIVVKNHYGVWQGFEDKMRVALKSHTESDVMQINYAWLSEYSPNGDGFYNLYDVADYLELSNYTQDDLQYGVIDGKLNAVPIAFNTVEFFYNKGIWDSYDLEFPTRWEDFFAAAKVMKKDGIYPLGMVKKQAFMFVLSWFEQTHGKNIFNIDGSVNINSEDAKDILVLYKRLIDEKVLMPIDDFDRAQFSKGNVAATMCWVSDAGNYCNALFENGGIPKLGGMIIEEDAKLNGWYIKPATMYAISAYTDNPVEAAKLLNFLVNSEDMAVLQCSEKGVPVSRAALRAVQSVPDGMEGFDYKASVYMDENRDKMEIIRPVMENDGVITAFKECGDEYIYNQDTLEQIARKMLDRFAEEIAK